MNTRLQVEHPVTELVTGIDLVEQMIRVAAGEKLPFKQSDIALKGWAVESRVYAEDPFRNFLPSIGRLVKYRPPAEGKKDGITVRNDTGVFEGGEISMYYDPMIAKLVTHAPTREAAIEAQSAALDAFYIDGIQHNVPFLAAVMQHPRWRSGKISTGFIKEEFPEGFEPRAPEGADLVTLAAVAGTIDHLGNTRRRDITHQMAGRSISFAKRRVVKVGQATVLLEAMGPIPDLTTSRFWTKQASRRRRSRSRRNGGPVSRCGRGRLMVPTSLSKSDRWQTACCCPTVECRHGPTSTQSENPSWRL